MCSLFAISMLHKIKFLVCEVLVRGLSKRVATLNEFNKQDRENSETAIAFSKYRLPIDNCCCRMPERCLNRAKVTNKNT